MGLIFITGTSYTSYEETSRQTRHTSNCQNKMFAKKKNHENTINIRDGKSRIIHCVSNLKLVKLYIQQTHLCGQCKNIKNDDDLRDLTHINFQKYVKPLKANNSF